MAMALAFRANSGLMAILAAIALIQSMILIITNTFEFQSSRSSPDQFINLMQCPRRITVIRGGLDPPRGMSGFGSYFFVELAGLIEDILKSKKDNEDDNGNDLELKYWINDDADADADDDADDDDDDDDDDDGVPTHLDGPRAFVIIPKTDEDSAYFKQRGNLSMNKWSRFFRPVNEHLLSCLADQKSRVQNYNYNMDIHIRFGRIKAWPYGVNDYGDTDQLNSTWYYKNRRRGHAIVSRYHRPQPAIQRHIENLHAILLGDKYPILGIHMRGTDKLGAGGRKIVSVETYLPYIRSFKKKFAQGGVFVATDDANMLKELSGFGIDFISQSIPRGAGEETIPFRLEHSEGPEALGIEIMSDIYMLSRCDYMLHGISSVIEAVMHINLKLHENSINLEYGIEGQRIPWEDPSGSAH